MKPALVFVHGLANGPAYRRTLHEIMQNKIDKAGIGPMFRDFRVAQWRSRGSWSADVTDMGHPDGIRAQEAADDVDAVLSAALQSGPVELVGHSMGAVLARIVVNRHADAGNRLSLITVGNPMGNPILRAGIALQSWSRRTFAPAPVDWIDIWNRQDPICADILMGYSTPVGVQRAIEVIVPGTPGMSDPLAEHGSYFDQALFWENVHTVASGLDLP